MKRKFLQPTLGSFLTKKSKLTEDVSECEVSVNKTDSINEKEGEKNIYKAAKVEGVSKVCLLSSSPNENPVQPTLNNFPVEKGRKFASHWYLKHSWIEYNVKDDALFCFCCHFGFNQVRSGETIRTRRFIDQGFRNWKDTGADLKKHEDSERHKYCMEAWSSFRMIKNNQLQAIASVVNKERSKKVAENRHHMRMLLEVTSFLGRQALPFRGHDEKEDSDNEGKFVEALELLSKNDPVLQSKLQKRYGHYCSPEYQNTYISIFGNRIKNLIAEEVKKAKFFAIIAGETKDISKKEQLALLVRYLDKETLQIKERAIGVYHVRDLTAESLSKEIVTGLKKLGLDPQFCVGQCYDGAKVMSSQISGVQTRFRSEAPHAVYLHCRAHCLNLVLVHAIKNINEAQDFFSVVKKLYDYITNSNTRLQIFVNAQEKLKQEVLMLERTVFPADA